MYYNIKFNSSDGVKAYGWAWEGIQTYSDYHALQAWPHHQRSSQAFLQELDRSKHPLEAACPSVWQDHQHLRQSNMTGRTDMPICQSWKPTVPCCSKSIWRYLRSELAFGTWTLEKKCWSKALSSRLAWMHRRYSKCLGLVRKSWQHSKLLGLARVNILGKTWNTSVTTSKSRSQFKFEAHKFQHFLRSLFRDGTTFGHTLLPYDVAQTHLGTGGSAAQAKLQGPLLHQLFELQFRQCLLGDVSWCFNVTGSWFSTCASPLLYNIRHLWLIVIVIIVIIIIVVVVLLLLLIITLIIIIIIAACGELNCQLHD